MRFTFVVGGIGYGVSAVRSAPPVQPHVVDGKVVLTAEEYADAAMVCIAGCHV